MKDFDLENFKVWKLHVFFWICLYIFSTVVLSRNRSLEVTLIISTVNFITVVPIIYFLLFYLLPKFWNINKILFFTLFTVVISIVGLFRDYSVEAMTVLFGANINEIGEDGFLFQITVEILFLLMIGLPLKFITSFIENVQREKKMLKQKLLAEMKFLRLQLNPHFLFNALNNVYSVSFRNNDSSSGMILKIAEILRYILYESNEATVSIQDEIRFIENFIELNKIDKEFANIHFSKDIQADIEIVPHLFMPLIENAFKFSDLNVENSFVDIEIHCTQIWLSFEIKNSTYERFTSQSGGIGLENLKQRLEIYYPNKYEMKNEQKEGFYWTLLEINF